MSKPQRIYIAGAMTGLPEYNFPAFNAAAAQLRALGYHVENPAENPSQEHQAEPWQHYMRKAIAQMVTCDAVVRLPGWAQSAGAMLESDIAQRVGIPCHSIESFIADSEVA
jgi:hypothetical protein